MIGTRLGNRYELLERIGGGGMSLVYKARDTLLNRMVAVKVLRSQYASDEDVVRRFRREAQASASLGHQNIVQIYDVGEENDIYYIVMEYVAGQTLKHRIQEHGPLSTEEVLELSIQICEALEHAHANRIIHRDIKPHNIMLTEGGRAKVADFGIARAATSSTLTHSGTIIGSVHYFSPEQARGGFAGEKSDLYSLGVVMYEMLTGKVPFEGDSPISIALKHVQEPVIAPRRKNPHIPESVEKVVMKALAKDPVDRYESAAAMLAELRHLAEGLPAEEEKRELPVVENKPERERPKPPVHVDRSEARTQRRRRGRVPWLLIVLILAVAGGGAGYYVFRNWLTVSTVQVPNVVGQGLTEAQKVLRDRQLVPVVIAEKYDDKTLASHIISQQPESGAAVKTGRTINLVVSMGQEFTVVPDLTNKSQREATIAIQASSLELGLVRQRQSATIAADAVISQNPRPGTRVPKGTVVDIEVSEGSETVIVLVPSFIGDNIDVVLGKLVNYKLVQGTVTQREAREAVGTVIGQDPPPGAEVKEGTVADFVVSKGPATGGSSPGGATPGGTNPGGTGGGGAVPTAHKSQVAFRVPGAGVETVSVRITLTDTQGTRNIYQQKHTPGTEIRLSVEWSGPEARVRYFVNESLQREDSLR